MNKLDLLREVENLPPEQRAKYEAVKGYADSLAEALAFAKGTMKVGHDTSTVTTTRVVADPALAYRDRVSDAWKGAN